MIKVSECKEQCSIDADLVDFDPWFRRTAPAATTAVQTHLNRKLYATQEELTADTAAPVGAMVVTEDLRHAMLMLIAHWFENRETSSELTIKDVPMAFDFLTAPYKLINL